MGAVPGIGLGDKAGVAEYGAQSWGPAYAVDRVGDEGEGGGVYGTRHWVVGVSTETVLATGRGKRSDTDEKPVRSVMVSTDVPEYAGVHAEYTGETDWLGREGRTVAPLNESVLESVWY